MTLEIPGIDLSLPLALMERRDYRGALRALREQGSPGDERANRAHQVARCECLVYLGRARRSVPFLATIASELRRGEDHDLYGWACLVQATGQYYSLGRIEDATENALMALYSFKRVDNVVGMIRSLNLLGNLAYSTGDFRRSVEHTRACLEMARLHGVPRWETVASYNLGSTHLKIGRHKEAADYFAGLAESFETLGDGLNRARLQLSKTLLAIETRDFATARTNLTECAPELRDCRYVCDEGIWHEYMGHLCLVEGTYQEASVHLTEAIRRGITSGTNDSLLGQSRRLLAEVRLAEGNATAALEEAQRARVSIDKVGERFEDGAVHRVIGEAHAKLGNEIDARDAFRHGIDVLQMIGARLEWARACLSAGRCNLFDDRERLGYLVEADRLFAEIGVEYWIAETKSTLGELLHREAPRNEVRRPTPSAGNGVIVAEDSRFREILSIAERVASSDIAVLLTGETGTGKDLVARHIHDLSPRAGKPFVPIDLSTIPETLWESELFGHCKGTFTGAQEKQGLLASADGGTVFLNEVGNFPLVLQAKLLEFLETRRIRRLGGTEALTLDVRLVAATNADLTKVVANGQFRSDLYFRLAPAALHLPPLRERRGDILPLIRQMMAEFGMSESRIATLAAQGWVRIAQAHDWPGNIRQLRNFLWNLIAIAGSANAPDLFDWADKLIAHVDNGNCAGQSPSIPRAELVRLLYQHDWNRRAVARELGVSESSVRNWIKRYGIVRPDGG